MVWTKDPDAKTLVIHGGEYNTNIIPSNEVGEKNTPRNIVRLPYHFIIVEEFYTNMNLYSIRKRNLLGISAYFCLGHLLCSY